VSLGDRLKQRIVQRLNRRDRNVCGKDRLPTRRKLELSVRRLYVGSEAEDPRRAHEIFNRAAQSEMHFSTKQVKGA
jgi:hypothetical protein